MKNRDELLKAQQDRMNHLSGSFSNSDELYKGKKADIGEVREHGGKKYKKMGEGKWVPVTDGKSAKKEDDPKGNKPKKEEGRSSSKESTPEDQESPGEEAAPDPNSPEERAKVSATRDTETPVGKHINSVVERGLKEYDSAVRLEKESEGSPASSLSYYINSKIEGFDTDMKLIKDVKSPVDVETNKSELKEQIHQMLGAKRDYYDENNATTSDTLLYNKVDKQGMSKEEKSALKKSLGNLVKEQFKELANQGKMTKTAVGFRGAEKSYWAVTKPGTEMLHAKDPSIAVSNMNPKFSDITADYVNKVDDETLEFRAGSSIADEVTEKLGRPIDSLPKTQQKKIWSAIEAKSVDAVGQLREKLGDAKENEKNVSAMNEKRVTSEKKIAEKNKGMVKVSTSRAESKMDAFDDAGLVEGKDFEANYARGDDIPNAIKPITDAAKKIMKKSYEDEIYDNINSRRNAIIKGFQ